MKGQKWPTFTPPATTQCRRYRGRVLLRRLHLDHFTQKAIPVLCIHDSFIIQYDKEPELRDILDQATHQITKSRVGHDIKNERNTHTRLVSGNIKGFENPVSMKSYTPIRIKPTKQYLTRKNKFSKWLGLLGEVEDHDDL